MYDSEHSDPEPLNLGIPAHREGPLLKDTVVPMTGTIVLVRGTLRGLGRQAECELLARRNQSPELDSDGNRRYTFTGWQVLTAPSDFPDGEYTATTTQGDLVPVVKTGALWVAGTTSQPATPPREKSA